MQTVTKKVIKVESAKNKNGKSYQRAVLEGNEYQPLFGELAKKVTGAGTYEMVYEDASTPWKLVDVRIADIPGVESPHTRRDERRDESILFRTAIKAASEVLAGRFQQSYFNIEKAIEYAPRLRDAFLATVKKEEDEE